MPSVRLWGDGIVVSKELFVGKVKASASNVGEEVQVAREVGNPRDMSIASLMEACKPEEVGCSLGRSGGAFVAP